MCNVFRILGLGSLRAMRAKFGSILGADVTDEICEYHSVRRVSSVREYRKSLQYQRSKRSFDLEAGAATTQSVPFVLLYVGHGCAHGIHADVHVRGGGAWKR